MKLHELGPEKGATKKRKRVGRGPGSGHGKTSGRGQKGQLSRSGGGKGPGFEGGQTPIQRQLPKFRGFKNPFRKVYAQVNLDQLSGFPAKSVVDPGAMREAGLVRKALPVKVLGRGEIERPLTVRAHAFSASAAKRIEAAGGKAEVVT